MFALHFSHAEDNHEYCYCNKLLFYFNYQVPVEEQNYTIKPLNGPSIVIVIEGDGHTESNGTQTRIEISPGATIFSPAKHSLTINCNGNGLLAFQAYCQIS